MYAAIAYNAQYMVKHAREIQAENPQPTLSHQRPHGFNLKAALKRLFTTTTPTLGH